MILSNTKYATSRILFFKVLFATQCLSSHGFLRGQMDTVEEQVVSNCKSWCKNHEQGWDEKCKWQVNCAGCSECFDSSPEVMDFQHEEEEDELPCMNWCESHQLSWDEKCDWSLKCAGCSQCQSEVDSPHIEDPIDNPSPLSISVSMGCEVWCANHDTPWYDPGATGVGQKCSWLKNCGGCSECEQYLRCDDHCETNNDLPWVVPDDPDAVQKCISRTCGGCVRCLSTAVDEDEDDTPTPSIAPSSIPSTSSIPTEDVLECRDWCNFVSPRLVCHSSYCGACDLCSLLSMLERTP